MDSQEQSALRWGGLSGFLGSVLLLGVFGMLAAFVGLETVEGEAAVARFPDIRWARIIENTAYLLTLALWALHSVVLLIALRHTRFGMALAGAVMSFLGLAVLAAGAIPHTATTAISELYHAPETAAELKPVLVVAWQTSQAWVDTFVVTGIALTPIGMLLFGIAMLSTPSYGKWMGWIGILLAAAGIYAAVMSLIEEGDIVAIGVFALVFFHVIVGWRTFRLAAS
jgi:hypothetical protein